MMDKAIYISPEKKTELESELKERKEIIRIDILAKLKYAKSLGDLSENAEYHDARERQGKNESRIQEIEHILKNFVLVKKSSDGSISLGSKVVIAKERDPENKKEYTVVGPAEADMSVGKISSESPLGEILINKKSGDSVELKTAKGTTNYKILKVD